MIRVVYMSHLRSPYLILDQLFADLATTQDSKRMNQSYFTTYIFSANPRKTRNNVDVLLAKSAFIP